MAEGRRWPALIIQSGAIADPPHADEEALAVLLDDFGPIAIEDCTPWPLPPGGLWDPTCPPPPDPPLAPLNWKVFFSSVDDRHCAADALRQSHPEFVVRTEDVADDDWAARSQRELRAVGAGAFLIAPPWDVPSDCQGATIVIIEPSRGFGTGHHASTRLCLRALSDLDVHGRRVLDLGTGSGVLALAASVRGASEIVGIDVDPDAIQSARHSQALNPDAGNVRWLTGDFRESPGVGLATAAWDVVLANLTGGMLRASAPRIRALLAPGGWLIAGGFDLSERSEVVAAMQLREISALVEQEWVGIVLTG